MNCIIKVILILNMLLSVLHIFISCRYYQNITEKSNRYKGKFILICLYVYRGA